MFVGVDIGTSSTKAGCFDAQGRLLALHQVSYTLSHRQPGFSELRAELLLEAVTECLQKMCAAQKEIKSITISGLGEAIALLDAKGHPLTPFIMGTDARGENEWPELLEHVGRKKMVDVTCCNPLPIYSVSKLSWLRRHQPDLFDRARRICTVQDFVIGRLCGTWAIDYSMASRTALFDVGSRSWSDELMKAAGIDASRFSMPVPAGTLVGYLRCDIVQAIGCDSHIAVIAGTHDHLSNAFGAGVIERGWASNTCGTTEGITAMVEMPTNRELMDQNGFSIEPFDDGDVYATVAWNNTSGALFRWLMDFMAENQSQYRISKWSEKMDINRPSRLMVLPHFSGAATPHADPKSRGAILGLTLETTPQEVLHAMMEGASFELLLICDALKRAGISYRHMVSTGAAASETVLKIKSNLLGRPIHTVHCKQTGTLGGAMLGMVSQGVYESLSDAAQNVVHLEKTYQPDERLHKTYKERYQLYQKLYQATCEIHHALGKRENECQDLA